MCKKDCSNEIESLIKAWLGKINSEVGHMTLKDSSGVCGFNRNIPIYHLQGTQINVELKVGHMTPKDSSKDSSKNH